MSVLPVNFLRSRHKNLTTSGYWGNLNTALFYLATGYYSCDFHFLFYVFSPENFMFCIM